MSNLELHENNIEAALLILKEQIKVNKELLEYLKVNQSEHISSWRLEKIQDLIEKQEQVKVLVKD